MSEMERAVGRNRAELFRKAGRLFVRAALWSGELCARWPRHCPPPHAAFRTLCPQAGQSVRSEAHYAAAVPRLARPASGGGRSKTGQSAALTCRRSLCPGGAGGGEVLRGETASLPAAARGVSDTLPSNRAKCSLRGALRGGSAASGSAGIGRRAGKSRAERRPALPRRPSRPVFSLAFPRPSPAPPCCPLRPPLHAVSKK